MAKSLNCENRWVILSFQFQDGSDGAVCLPLFRHPGLHDDCRDRSLSLSLVDGSDDNSRDAETHFSFSSAWAMMAVPPWWCRRHTEDGCFHINTPSFIAKMANKNRHKIGAVLLYFRFFFLNFCLFSFVSPYLLLFHDILEPQKQPTKWGEVTGINRFWTFPVQSPQGKSKLSEKRHVTLKLAGPRLDG